MDFEELSSTGNGGKYQIQRLSGIEHLRMAEEASITDELTCRKCLSITYVDNNFCEDTDIPETQKLKEVGSWAELFLDKHYVEDSIKETGKFDLDFNTENRMVQKRRGMDAADKSADHFYLKLLHSDFLSPCVASEHHPEHSEIWNPCNLLDNNASSFANKILNPGCIAKHQREEKDIIVSSNVRRVHEVAGHMHSSTIKNNFQNSHIIQKGDDPFVPMLGSQKNETYFWAPLSDSSDEECEEWPEVKANSLKLLAAESKKSKSPCDTASFFRPEDRKLFSFRVLGGRLCCTETSDSSEEKWNPENAEIKEHKCQNFRQIEKHEVSTETINNVESLSEEATKRNIFFSSKAEVKKDLSKDELLDFQPLQEIIDQRNESEAGHTREMGKLIEGNTYAGEDDAKSTHNRGYCRRDQRKTELKSQRKEPTLQMNIFCGNLSSKPSENSTCKTGVECSNLIYKNTDLCSNSDCTLLDSVPRNSDETMTCMLNIVPRCLQDDIKENISEDVVKSIVGSKSGAGELQSERMRADVYQKLFWNDKSHSDDSILAKYYFYLNYLNESKRLQYEDGNHSFSCQQCSKEANVSTLCLCKSNSLYEQQAEECMNSNFGVSEISCHKDKRPEALKQQTHPEQQESKAVFANISPKPMSNLTLSTSRQLGNLPILKGCTSCRQISVKVSSRNLRKRSNDQNGRKCFLNNADAWTESREHHDSVVPGCDEVNLIRQGDHNLLPWLLLPDELWFCIFSLLTHKDISRVSQVCHRFYQLARDESFWKVIHLTNCHCLNDDWLIALGNRHPQRFTLDHCHDDAQRITHLGLKQFFQQCQGSLKELNIRSCSGPGFRGDTILLYASTFCHNLRIVDVSWTGATDSGLIALVKASTSLQCLSANGCRLTDGSVDMLIEDHGKRLKKLEIFGCHAITAKCLRSAAVKCPNLKVLNIGRVPKTTEDCFAEIANCMEKLTSLNCTGLNTVRDHVVHFIVKKCPELECLILNSCSHLTDISLMEISTHLSSIRYLDVGGCEKVTDIGVQALAGRCHKISYLDLSSTATSKRGVCLLASFCFRTLECVKLSFCKNISLDAIGKLCRNCKKLKILHLYGCHLVPDLESIKNNNKTVEVFYDLRVPADKLLSE